MIGGADVELGSVRGEFEGHMGGWLGNILAVDGLYLMWQVSVVSEDRMVSC